jgi:DNA modification methylase
MNAYWDNGPVQLYQADARSIPLADQSVHCVVTSPPYFGLRVYKDNDDRGIGLESTVEDYIGNLVDIFREVRRVLRDDGVAWLNLGDSYSSTGGHSDKGVTSWGQDCGFNREMGNRPIGLAQGNRLGIPERVVLALQADGWTWRDTIIWAKKSAMPESLAGWRWERCRVKVDTSKRGAEAWGEHTGQGDHVNGQVDGSAQWEDCPGCPKCADNDGLVLRRGSWRTTQAHEYIYMLTKGMGYYADGEAVKTAALQSSLERSAYSFKADGGKLNDGHGTGVTPGMKDFSSGANRRSVWNDISPEPYGGSHFATFPSDLPRICIQASTSERGCCPECGSQWARVIEHKNGHSHDGPKTEASHYARGGTAPPVGTVGQSGSGRVDAETQTLGWRPTCNHNAPAIPATVLDPFSGTATTCRAAQKLGRRAVGVDISEAYLDQAVRRLSAVTLPMGI